MGRLDSGVELRGRISSDLPLLVVALPEEAAALDSRLPVLVTGPGKVRAANAVASALAAARPASVVNIGTAGALREGLVGVHEVGTVLQHDFDDAGVFATLGARYGAPIDLGAGLVLATGDRFVAGGAMREALAVHAHLCDMEGYAVALAAHAVEVPMRLVKLVSDDADESAGATWQAALAGHARTLADWVLHNIAVPAA
ncbi:MAG: hypothetical protein KGP01_05725 [Actinomycetales bacterium]|nr:hypothetical protein [Actinomycetales bacterium]